MKAGGVAWYGTSVHACMRVESPWQLYPATARVPVSRYLYLPPVSPSPPSPHPPGEAASVVLMGDRLSQVVDCISLGRATLSKIKQNLAWALVYNVIGIPLAAGALLPSMGIALNPSAAGGMMAFSSVAVVSNSLLLRAQYAADADSRHARLAAAAAAAGSGGGDGGNSAGGGSGAAPLGSTS